MNAEPRPANGNSGPPPGWHSLTAIADRIEKNVRWYRWLTLANVIVFGTNTVMLALNLIAAYWLTSR